MNNVSYVSAIPTAKGNEAGIVSINLGIGYNRLKDFNSNAYILGDDIEGSYMDYFADNANNGIWSDYYEELAWKTDMLLYDENNGEYWHDIQDAGYGQSQRKSYSRSGSIDEYSFAISLNFNHKVYVGASFAMLNMYYRESITTFEKDNNDNIPYFNEMSFNSYLRTSGYGQNFKFGIIYKPVNEVRLGVSLHTPSYYRLHDQFNTSMSSSITYDDGTERYDETSPYSNYDYRLQTPMKTTFSGAFIIAKKGLLSVDYELLSYNKAKLSRGGDGYDFFDENQDISEAYKTVGNIRVGGEYRIDKSWSARAGYQYQPSAFNAMSFGASQQNSNSKLMIYSAGLGYRTGGLFFDLAYNYSALKSFDLAYPVPQDDIYPMPQMAEFNSVKHDVLFTVGFKF